MRTTTRHAAAAALLAVAAGAAHADPAELSSWLLNSTGITGYGGLPANIQQIRYSASYVYVNASGIPSYAIGPSWGNDPNVPSNQGWLYKIPRTPTIPGVKTATGLGPIGAWVNGVAIFNAKDANSYNNQNVWHSNAVVVEAGDMDSCLGHPQMTGAYHHHQNPRCLYVGDSRRHSPILGFAFDGIPIYGPYGYANVDGSGGISRIRSSYRLRNITDRSSPAPAGPPISATFPLGYYVEDFEYVAGLGDLDAYNGRFAVTPDYPAGIYAYYATVDESGSSAYPYAIGPSYYGTPLLPNGHVTVGETVTIYAPSSPGRVPADLMADRVSSTQIQLTWNPSCNPAGASDYGIFEGTLGVYYSHTALTCADTLHDLKETITTTDGDHYYVVVPFGSGKEGSYGNASSGAEIPPGAPAFCAPLSAPATCP
jgi:hypothetical protein